MRAGTWGQCGLVLGVVDEGQGRTVHCVLGRGGSGCLGLMGGTGKAGEACEHESGDGSTVRCAASSRLCFDGSAHACTSPQPMKHAALPSAFSPPHRHLHTGRRCADRALGFLFALAGAPSTAAR